MLITQAAPRVRRVAGAAALGAALLTVNAPAAMAADDTGPRFAEDSTTRPVVLQLDEDGSWFWELELVDLPTVFIATWERKGGLWDSPEAASAEAVGAGVCRTDLYEGFLDDFTTHAEFSASPRVNHTSDTTWMPNDEQFSAQWTECAGEWDWSGVTSETDDESGTTRVHVPYDLIGSGTHDLFVVPLEANESRVRKDFPDGGWAGARPTEYTPLDVVRATVVVPPLPALGTDEHHLLGVPVEEGTWFEPSVFGTVVPLPWGGAAEVAEAPPADLPNAAAQDAGLERAQRAAAAAESSTVAPVTFVEPGTWWAPQLPRHLVAALLGGLALALLVAIPSAALERRARRAHGRVASAVESAFTPSDTHRAPPTAAPPATYGAVPTSLTTGSTFGADHETTQRTDRQDSTPPDAMTAQETVLPTGPTHAEEGDR